MGRRQTVLRILPIIFLLVTYSLLGQIKPNHARLTLVRGDVSICQETLSKFQMAKVGTGITASTRLNTGEDGLAEIQFADESKVRLAGNTDVQFTMLRHKPAWISSDRDTVLRLSRGTIYFLRDVTDRDIFHVNISNLWWSTDAGTVEFHASVEGNTALLTVSAGSVTTNMSIYPSAQATAIQAQNLKVSAHESIWANSQTGLVRDVARTTDLPSRDTWNMFRDQPSQNTVVKLPSIAIADKTTAGCRAGGWCPMCEQSDGAIREYTYDEAPLSGLPREFAVHCTPWVCVGGGSFSGPRSVAAPVAIWAMDSGVSPSPVESEAECGKQLGRTPGYDPRHRP